jgi:hypothetical protein
MCKFRSVVFALIFKINVLYLPAWLCWLNFLSNSEICRNENTIFLAICDGDYYLQKDSKTGDETKIKRLERLTDRKTSFALKIDDLKDFLAKF